MSVTKDLAEAVVRGWLADGQYGDIAKGRELPFFPFTNRIRTWLSRTNVLASNALWDGHPNTAYRLILAHGFGDKRRVEKPSPNDAKKYRASQIDRAANTDFRARHSHRPMHRLRVK